MDEILHHSVLLGHVTLEVDEFAQNALIAGFHRSEPSDDFIMTSGEVIDLTLKGVKCADIFDWGIGRGRGSRGADVAC